MTEDARIAALFAAPEREPDAGFVARVERAVLAERRAADARRTAWRRFAVECAASAAIVTAFGLLWRLGAVEMPIGPIPLAPASAAAILVLFLWFGVELRPAAAGR